MGGNVDGDFGLFFMILLIDNYDSFTYNIVQYLGELGAEVLVKRNDEITLEGITSLAPQGIVISPGPCTPNEAGISVELIKRFAVKIPILGVCLGHQAIGAAYGGDVIRAPYVMHGKTSEIHHDNKGIYKGIVNPFTATRYHSLIIDRKTLPDILQVTAETDDGLIMGVRHKEFKVEGVQFHPESILTPHGKQIIENWLNLCQP